MGKVVVIVLSLLCAWLPLRKVSAHTIGQPPFFRVNGIFSNFYPVPMDSYIALSPFPQDLGPEMYSVGTPIELAFDLDELSKVVPMEVINKTIFQWDFGDGTTGNGLNNIHTYKNPGSYVLSIIADTTSFEANAEPQIIQSVLLHVADDALYRLPKTLVLVNGKEGKDIPSDWLEFNLKKPIRVEAKIEEQGTSKIRSYQWDFGDGTTAEGITAEHTYASPPNSVMVILRVKDEKGFIVDSAAGLAHMQSVYSVLNNSNNSGTPIPKSSLFAQVRNFTILIIFSLCVISLLVWLKKS